MIARELGRLTRELGHLRELLTQAADSASEAALHFGLASQEEPPEVHAYAVAVRGAHTGAVLGLSCAVSKPLLVSCGADRTVRVWDYRAWQCQLVSPQPEGPLGVALHPDGMQLLLPFKVIGRYREIQGDTGRYREI